jgi:hypothetical protein
MGTVVRRVASEPQLNRTFSLTTQTVTNGRIINAEIRQPKSEKGTTQHLSLFCPLQRCLPLISI